MDLAQCNRHTGNLHWNVMQLKCDIFTTVCEFSFHLGCLPAAWRDVKEEATFVVIRRKTETGTGFLLKQKHHIWTFVTKRTVVIFKGVKKTCALVLFSLGISHMIANAGFKITIFLISVLLITCTLPIKCLRTTHLYIRMFFFGVCKNHTY